MKHLNKLILFFNILFICIGCSQVANFENFDSESWKIDKGGCEGLRSGMIQNLYQIKDEFKGLSQKEIVDILGQPDQKELYKRNQVYYTYFIHPGKDCKKTEKNQKTFIIRFSALNKANELQISTY